MSQSVCRDYQNGYCRFGSACRFTHPPQPGGNRDSFVPGRKASSGANAVPVGGGRVTASPATKYGFNEDSIKADLQSERPAYIISSYGAVKGDPNLFFGYDTQPEELRWKSLQALQRGQPQEYVKEEEDLFRQAQTTVEQALRNLTHTRVLAEKLHDARYPPNTPLDSSIPPGFSEEAVLKGATSTSTAFGSSSMGTPSAFGSSPNSGSGQSTSGNTAKPVAFGGTAALGTPTGPKASAFGASGTFGGGGGSAFGQSGFGQSSFGQNSGRSAFNSSPTAFGSNSKPSAFGGTSSAIPSPAGGGAFGQSAFGSSGFGGKPASAFGAKSSTSEAAPSAYGASPSPTFGQRSTPSGFGPAAAAFGQALTPVPAMGQLPNSAVFGQATAPASAFGQTSTPLSAFGQSSTPVSAFGQTSQTSGFGQSSTPAAAFGKSSAPTTSAFGQPSVPATSPFGRPATPSAFGSTGASTKVSTAGTAFGQSAFTQSPTSAFGTPAPTQRAEEGPSTAGGFGSFGGQTTSPSSTAPAVASAFGTASQTGSAFGSGTPFGQRPAFSTSTPGAFSKPSVPNFGPDVQIPVGWSYSDPWSWVMPKLEELDVETAAAYRSERFELEGIPSAPPPIELRG